MKLINVNSLYLNSVKARRAAVFPEPEAKSRTWEALPPQRRSSLHLPGTRVHSSSGTQMLKPPASDPTDDVTWTSVWGHRWPKDPPLKIKPISLKQNFLIWSLQL